LERFGGRPTIELLGKCVPVDHRSLQVGRNYALLDRVQQPGPKANFFFRFFAFGNVAQISGETRGGGIRMDFKPGSDDDLRLQLKVTWRHFLDRLKKVGIEGRRHCLRVKFPNDFAD